MSKRLDPHLIRYRGKWAIRYHDDRGIRRRYETGKVGRDEAEAVLSEWLRLRRSKPTTVAECWDRYYNEHGQYSSRPDGLKECWAQLQPYFGKRRAESITREDTRAYARKRQVSDGTTRKELGLLRACFRYCEKQEYITKAPQVWQPSAPPPKERYLTRDEAAKLVAAAVTPHVKLAIMIGLYTGARKGAILELQWHQVNFEREEIDFRNRLMGRRKGRAVIAIGDKLLAALQEAHKIRRTDWVVEFGKAQVLGIKTGFNASVRRAGLKGVSFHVLRHTFAVWAAEEGHSMSEIAQALGHANSQTTERVYARYSPRHLKKLVRAVEG